MIKYVLAGTAGGLISGFFGVGGGIVLVPLLVTLLGLAQHRAHATSLAAVCIMAAAGAAVFIVNGATDLSAGATIAGGGIAGAFIGSAIMHRLSDTRLGQAFAALMIAVALWMVVNPTASNVAIAIETLPLTMTAFALVGLAAGVISSIFGVGGGIIIVPLLTLLFGFSQHAAEATSLVAIVPISLAGALRQTRRGYTNWSRGLLLGSIGALSGAVGALAALQIDEALLQRLFAVLLTAAGVRLLMAKRRDRHGTHSSRSPT